MIETLGQQLPVVLVENVEQVEGLLTVCARLRLHGFADEEVLQDGQQRLEDTKKDINRNCSGYFLIFVMKKQKSTVLGILCGQ